MYKYKFISIITAAALLSGCGIFGKADENVINSPKETVGYVVETPTPEPSNTLAPSPVPTPSGTPTPTQVPVKPTPAATSSPSPKPVVQPSSEPQNLAKLDREILDKLENKKLSWWINLNNEHKPTTVPSDIKNMIDNHNGIYIGDTSKKVVYLTFDEGYENGYTPSILDTLKANNVKSIFFITGPYLDKNPELVKRMLDEGHQVGNHSINHPSLPTLSYASLEKELLGLETKFAEKFGEGFKYMRPPMGEYSQRTLEAAKQMGYKSIFWSYAFKDYDVNDQKGADYAYNKVMDNLHNGAVILLHAVSKDNAAALDRMIKDIRAQGYEIRPFDL